MRRRAAHLVSHWRRAAGRIATALATALAIGAAARLSIATGLTADDTITLRIIVVGSVEEAQRVVEQLAKGEDFAAVARRVSIDPTAESGGLLGRITVSTLRPELRNALQGLTVGQVSPVVRIPTGFAVLTRVPDASGGGAATGPVGPAGADGAVPHPGVAATGSVKYVLDVAGLGEMLAALSVFPKPADWDQDPRTICTVLTQSLSGAQTSLQADLVPGSASRQAAQPLDLIEAHFALGQSYAYQGRMEHVIEEFEKAYQVAAAHMPTGTPHLDEALGIAHLHLAWIENRVQQEPGDRCLLSTRGLAPLSKTTNAQKAVDHFLKYLAEKPDELEVRWLLNLAYMALGAYPDKVPPQQLIPAAAFASTDDVGRFVDVAPRTGLASVASAGGVIVDDFDNDGRLDVVISSYDSCVGMRLFHGNDGGTFTEQGAKAGISNQLGGLNLFQADYDNDGHLDMLLLRGAWSFAQRKSLLRNNGDGTFSDVTVASGVARPATRTQAAVWTDINQDGFLDLFVGSEDGPAQLFLNKKDGTFTDIARAAGVERSAFSKAVTATDYDNDGWPDLYVSNFGGTNFLYRNNHDNTFTEVSQSAGVPGSGKGFATWFFDYDNDGLDDLFVTSYFTSVEESVRTYLKLPHNAAPMKLYRNVGGGKFLDVTQQVGLDKVYMPMGANFGDIDNDGFLDIYLGTGNPSYGALVPSVLLRNRDGKLFVDVTSSSGTGELHKGHGVAFADLDNDGDEEIIFDVGGATPGDAHALRLFENPGHGNDWISVKLVGVKTNRSAIGAKIAVTVENEARGRRTIHRTIGTGGSFGASPLEQHIGLGKNARIVDIEIAWPTSQTRQRFDAIEKNQAIEIREFAKLFTRIDRKRVSLGGTQSASASTTPQRYAMKGMVVDVHPSRKSFTVSHDSVPGLMEAMTMAFDVTATKELDGVTPGTMVEFTLVVDRETSHAEGVHIRPYESLEQDPLTARRLALVKKSAAARSSASHVSALGPTMVGIGQAVPDFTLIDHVRRQTTLSQLRGKVVAINFIYTSCALPQFCFRMANHFGAIQKRFKDRLGRDLVLLTVTFDPVRDQPDTLAEYASRWRPDPDAWHFLTGPVPDVARVCSLFGVSVFQDEGLINHSLHTAIVDRQGTLIANIEGNQFTAAQLGDLIESALRP